MDPDLDYSKKKQYQYHVKIYIIQNYLTVSSTNCNVCIYFKNANTGRNKWSKVSDIFNSFTNFLKTTASDISSFVFDNYKEPVKEEGLPIYLSAEDIAKHNLEGDQRRLQRLLEKDRLEQQTKKKEEMQSFVYGEQQNGTYL